jgi:hypothetical protein
MAATRWCGSIAECNPLPPVVAQIPSIRRLLSGEEEVFAERQTLGPPGGPFFTEAGRSCHDLGMGPYLMRFQAISVVPPIDALRLHLSSSPVKEMTVRTCSVPVQLGYVLPSTSKKMVL